MSAFPEQNHPCLSLSTCYVLYANNPLCPDGLAFQIKLYRQAKVLIGLVQAHCLMSAGHLGSSF